MLVPSRVWHGSLLFITTLLIVRYATSDRLLYGPALAADPSMAPLTPLTRTRNPAPAPANATFLPPCTSAACLGIVDSCPPPPPPPPSASMSLAVCTNEALHLAPAYHGYRAWLDRRLQNACCAPLFGDLTLVMHWIGTTCRHVWCSRLVTDAVAPERWAVRGLWLASCEGAPMVRCDLTRAYHDVEARLAATDPALLQRLRRLWPSETRSLNDHWRRAWAEDGTCYSPADPACLLRLADRPRLPAALTETASDTARAGGVGGIDTDGAPTDHVHAEGTRADGTRAMSNYFAAALGLADQYDVYAALAQAGIVPGGTFLRVEIETALREAFGGSLAFSLRCMDGALGEVALRFNGASEPVYGTPSARPLADTAPCPRHIVYPSFDAEALETSRNVFRLADDPIEYV